MPVNHEYTQIFGMVIDSWENTQEILINLGLPYQLEVEATQYCCDDVKKTIVDGYMFELCLAVQDVESAIAALSTLKMVVNIYHLEDDKVGNYEMYPGRLSESDQNNKLPLAG